MERFRTGLVNYIEILEWLTETKCPQLQKIREIQAKRNILSGFPYGGWDKFYIDSEIMNIKVDCAHNYQSLGPKVKRLLECQLTLIKN